MKQPKGFEVPGREDLVCKLQKSIYGLKQSARMWNQKIHTVLVQDGYQQSKIDNCLYKKRLSKGWSYILIYVDDLIVASPTEDEIRRVEKVLQKNFKIKSLGELKCFLGQEIIKCPDGSYFLSQKSYIEKLLKRFEMENCKPSIYPLEPGYLKMNSSAKLPDNEKYRSLIGALLYLAVNSRPDIAVCTSILSQKNVNPTEEDWNEARRILRYLKFTINYALRLGGKGDQDLIAYSDASWADDILDRKSTSGGLFQFGGSTINWFSRKQSCVTLSSTEAECYALGDVVLEIMWLRQLLEEFDEKQTKPSTVFEDNQSCLKLTEYEQLSRRSKHIATRCYFIREKVSHGVVKCKFCPTTEMVADVLTKPLQATKMKKFSSMMGLVNEH